MTRLSHLRRAQRNKYAIVPLVVLTKNWPDSELEEYTVGAHNWLLQFQDWFYDQCGVTFKVLPPVVLRSIWTWLELQSGLGVDPYYGPRNQLDDEPHFDIEGERVEFCNPRRIYVLFETGQTRIANNAGRLSFGCMADPTNTMEPWGPGRSGGPSGSSMELVRGAAVAGSTMLLPTAGAGLSLDYTGGVVRCCQNAGGNAEFIVPAGNIALPASTRSYVFVDEDGVVKTAPYTTSGGTISLSTTLTAAAVAGATSVVVASAAGITLGRWYYLGPFGSGGSGYDVVKVDSLAGTTVNLKYPLLRAHAIGDPFDSSQSMGELTVWFGEAVTDGVGVTSLKDRDKVSRAAICHEMLHTLAFQHPTLGRDGSDVSQSVMSPAYDSGAWPLLVLTPYERAQGRYGPGGVFIQ